MLRGTPVPFDLGWRPGVFFFSWTFPTGVKTQNRERRKRYTYLDGGPRAHCRGPFGTWGDGSGAQRAGHTAGCQDGLSLELPPEEGSTRVLGGGGKPCGCCCSFVSTRLTVVTHTQQSGAPCPSVACGTFRKPTFEGRTSTLPLGGLRKGLGNLRLSKPPWRLGPSLQSPRPDSQLAAPDVPRVRET